MLTLLGSLLGFLGSLVPGILKFFKEKDERAHELHILDRQMEVMKLQHSHRLEEIGSWRDMVELKELYRYPSALGIKWIDTLSGSVRPVLTYGFFILYLGVKLSQVLHVWPLIEGGIHVHLVTHVWHEEDQALFAAVMAFWFGQRAMGKIRK